MPRISLYSIDSIVLNGVDFWCAESYYGCLKFAAALLWTPHDSQRKFRQEWVPDGAKYVRNFACGGLMAQINSVGNGFPTARDTRTDGV